MIAMNEAQESIGVVSHLASYFPYVIGPNQFLEVRFRNHIEFFHQLKNPRYFLRVFRRKVIEEFFDGTRAVAVSVEYYITHSTVLTNMLTRINKGCGP